MDNYYKYTYKSRLQKSIKTLQGIIQGISIDSVINEKEIEFINNWLSQNIEFKSRHPFNEVIPLLEESLEDKILSKEEQKDIIWLCNKLSIDNGFFDYVTQDMQKFHGILTGIISDGVVSDKEVGNLKSWIFKNNHLKTLWPYDELESILISITKDGVIDEEERESLFSFLYEFSSVDDDLSLTDPIYLDRENLITGVCSVDPNVTIESKTYAFTGKSEIKSRNEFHNEVLSRGGFVKNTISKKIDYLVIGSAGNPCWAYSCYGRKVEQAIKLRKQGIPLVIMHEIDFLDAIVE